MKAMKSVLTALLLTLAVAAGAWEKTVDNPQFAVNLYPNLVVERVVLTDSATTLHMAYYERRGRWFAIAAGSALLADGRSLPLRRAEGIDLDERIKLDSTGVRRFRLIFPPVAASTPSIDFTEGNTRGAFQIFGISLADSPSVHVAPAVEQPAPTAQAIAEANEPLPVPQWKLGSTRLRGRVIGYRPGMAGKSRVYIPSEFEEDLSNERGFDIAPDGSFSVEVPLCADHEAVYVELPGWYGPVILSQDGDCVVTLDLVAMSHAYTPETYLEANKALHAPDLNRLTFAGPFALVNTQLSTPEVRHVFWASFEGDKTYKPAKGTHQTVRQYCDNVLSWRDKMVQTVDTMHIYGRTAEVLRMELNRKSASQLVFRHDYVGYDSNGRPICDPCLLETLKLLNVNDMRMLYACNYGSLASDLGSLANSDSAYYAKRLKLFHDIGLADTARVVAATDSLRRDFFASVLGRDDCPIYDMMELEPYSRQFYELKALAPWMIERLNAHHSTAIRDYYMRRNESQLAAIERMNASGKFSFFSQTDGPGVAVLDSIVASLRGKTVLVDMWGTWCGPCRNAIKRMEPHKEEWAKRDIEFVYITDNKSPEDEWLKMKPTIHGHHFRLSERQASDIFAKYGFRGWPSYIIFNSEGKYVYRCTGYMANEIKAKFDELNPAKE